MFMDARKEDAGDYKCIASEIDQVASAPITLKLYSNELTLTDTPLSTKTFKMNNSVLKCQTFSSNGSSEKRKILKSKIPSSPNVDGGNVFLVRNST